MKKFFLLMLVFLGLTAQLVSQGKFDDSRVMLQGFYWESCQQGGWYNIIKENVEEIREARFDLIWLPPPSFAGEKNAGYQPKEYFKFDNSYGSSEQQRTLLEALWSKGIEPVADIVINHRDGTHGWTGFENPEWNLEAIVKEDEAFYNNKSEAYGKESDAKYDEDCADYIKEPMCIDGACDCSHSRHCSEGNQTCQYNAFRDLAHANDNVRSDIMKFLLSLKSMGYRGWRFDMVHGYHARWISVYNQVTHPTFSVGEYDWGRHDESRGWIWNTATEKENLQTSSCIFDFSTYFTLKDNKGKYQNWYAYGNGIGLVGDNTDGKAWKNKAVTFIENHDTGFRKGDPNHTSDSFKDGWEAEQAYAYILTHPGIPCVYWKHYFEWKDNGLPLAIKALINARKVAGVNSGSQIVTQKNAKTAGVYAALIEGTKAKLCVRVGGDDSKWNPDMSGYQGYQAIAEGNEWKVWVNSSKKEAPLNKSIGQIPDYIKPENIEIDKEWLQLQSGK